MKRPVSNPTAIRTTKSFLGFLLVLVVLLNGTVQAQTTIWSENFETGYSDNDETAQDNNSPAGADWTKTGTPSNWWRVETDNVLAGSFSMNGRNLDATMTWTSETIDISDYTNVSISIDLKEINCEGGDLIQTFYNVGAGDIEFGDGNGDGNFDDATNTISGLSGSTLTIVVTLLNNGGGERLIFDNISVTGISTVGRGGPGGVGKTDGTGSMSLWLDANQGVTLSGTEVTQWSDQSGYGNDCTPPAVSNRPDFDATGTNSHPVITFDGVGDYLTAADDNSLDLTTWSIVVVGIVNTHKNYNAFVVKGDDAQENYEFLTNFPSTGNIHYPVRYTSGGRSTDSEAGETVSTTEYGIYQLDYDQSNFEIHINGDQTETDAETRIPLTNADDLYIGNEAATTGREVDASVAEIVMYSTPLNTMERIILHNAMSAKYGFDLDANDLYDEDDNANGDFDFDVAGIGQFSDGTSHQDAQGTGMVRIYNPAGLANSEYLFWGHNNEALSSFGETDLPSGVEARLAREWRVSETGEVGTTSIAFDLGSVFGSIAASDLRLLIDTDNDGVFSDETGSGVLSGATNTSGTICEWTGVDLDNNQRFTIGSVDSDNTPLPIELLSFTASVGSDRQVDLQWETAAEINNDFFTIERSHAGNDWEAIGFVEGAGNSSSLRSYEFTDREPILGRSFYRLRQTDFDGQFELSDTEPIFLQEQTVSHPANAYPNPTTGILYVEHAGNDAQAVRLFNMHGQDLTARISVSNSGSDLLQLDLTSLPTGLYLVQVGEQVIRVNKN